jgi:hypothetical protein
VSRLVVVLAPWMVVSVGVNVSFPLAFVANRLRALPWIGAAALGMQVLLAWIGVELGELDGLALSLAVSTLFVLAALLAQLDAVEDGLRGIAAAAGAVVALTCAAFVPPGVVAGGAVSAVVGVAIYVALVALVRPRALRESWSYLRALR